MTKQKEKYIIFVKRYLLDLLNKIESEELITAYLFSNTVLNQTTEEKEKEFKELTIRGFEEALKEFKHGEVLEKHGKQRNRKVE